MADHKSLNEELAELRTKLEALERIKTQEDFDEGARLHIEKNAPWVNGQYAHLKFPPYEYRAFPKMLYDEQYEAACQAYIDAQLIPATGINDRERKVAVDAAVRDKALHSRIVATVGELEAWRSRGWHESPAAAVAAVKGRLEELAILASHRHYEDRHLSAAAQRESDAVDEAADSFVAEIPATAIRAKARPPARVKEQQP